MNIVNLFVNQFKAELEANIENKDIINIPYKVRLD